VPCERLFSSSKQVTTERRSRLGSNRLEQLLVMKSAWMDTIVDWAAINSAAVEEIEMNDFTDLLQADNEAREWDEEDERFIFDLDSDY
jgi:hypothetical protein